MAAISVKTGPISADDPARDVPPEKWFNLTLARRSAIHVNIPYDCRSLIGFVAEAEQFRMWEKTGHANLDSYIRDGLNIDPELIEWAKLGLAAIGREKPVPLATAVDAGKAAAEQMRDAPDNAKSSPGPNPANCDYITNTRTQTGGGTSSSYLAARIKRDAPEIAERVMAGEFRSIRQAAIAAGIVKETPPLVILKRTWKRMTENEQREFLHWISNEQ